MQIYIENNRANLDDENVQWGVKSMIKFYDVFKPILDECCNVKN